MYSGLKKNILSYLVNNPGGKNTETLKYLSGFLSGPDKEFVKQLEEEKQEVTENYNRLLAEFNVYKESMMLLKASGDKGQALKFINQMVREIDKCIALLNK